MSLPEFNEFGDLPVGVHRASLDDVVNRFEKGSPQRVEVTKRLIRIHDLAAATGSLDRLIIFGSYVTDKTEPNDVDVVLVFNDKFIHEDCSDEALILLDHGQADEEFGASVFWVRPCMILTETVDAFIARWQTKRDGTSRGIVEIRYDTE